jgi:hypothetical protein
MCTVYCLLAGVHQQYKMPLVQYQWAAGLKQDKWRWQVQLGVLAEGVLLRVHCKHKGREMLGS